MSGTAGTLNGCMPSFLLSSHNSRGRGGYRSFPVASFDSPVDFVGWLLVLSVLPYCVVDFIAVATCDDCPADFMVVGFIISVFRGFGACHLSRFMHVARFLVAVVPGFLSLFLASFGYMSFCYAEFAAEFLFVSVLHSLVAWPFLLHLKH